MKIKEKCPINQVCFLLLIFFLSAVFLTMTSCSARRDERPVIPPLSSPLSQQYVGFGVINVSYTRLMNLPEGDNERNTSSGHLRRGTVVSVQERRMIRNNNSMETWLLVEENINDQRVQGWLRESLVDVYENELQAHTASNSMLR